VNPLLYVLGYGASFVAQGSPADMAGLTRIIEEGIRFPGFAFINVQSPCVTYGEEEQQLKAQKARIQNLETIGHDPADLALATERARDYGTKLYTGVLYRNPNPPATYGQGVTARRESLKNQAVPRNQILNRFLPVQ
jgi:2-oxoglutarate ferredoxin oxidoreductase subunit beta